MRIPFNDEQMTRICIPLFIILLFIVELNARTIPGIKRSPDIELKKSILRYELRSCFKNISEEASPNEVVLTTIREINDVSVDHQRLSDTTLGTSLAVDCDPFAQDLCTIMCLVKCLMRGHLDGYCDTNCKCFCV